MGVQLGDSDVNLPAQKAGSFSRGKEQATVSERPRYRISPDRGVEFFDAIERASREHPRGRSVEVHPREFYQDPQTKLYLGEDGLAGAAVTRDGNLVSVFKHPNSKSDIRAILDEPAQEARYLDAFDANGFLPELYGQFGFRTEIGGSQNGSQRSESLDDLNLRVQTEHKIARSNVHYGEPLSLRHVFTACSVRDEKFIPPNAVREMERSGIGKSLSLRHWVQNGGLVVVRFRLVTTKSGRHQQY